ncbi:MAG: phosphoribosylanthranilate isomerase [Acidobacteriia bacterium]|nr:phosphoribosylanthranilate isomerase [Terriglobia bacterium]
MVETRVKICGITRIEDGVAAAESGSWAVGFVLHAASPRLVSAAEAARIAKALPPGVLRVGVFLHAPAGLVRTVEAEVELDLVQLHGDGAEATCRAVGPERVILAARLARDGDVERALELPSAHVLVDHDRSLRVPASGTTDWNLAERLARRRELTLLAGGLTSDTVEGAIRRVRPWGVDVSRGVESAPGIKDKGRILEFVERVRRADAS